MSGTIVAGGTIDEYYYVSGAWTVTDAQTYCASPPAGTWVQ
ncbi:MAG: hypothetical protein WCC48_15810 [Anaeromyxobacteraceae bacterium]